MNRLSRKDIAMLEVLAVTEESKGKLAEYVQQREKAAKAYKAFREAVVNGVEVEEVEKAVEPKRKFKAGDKVRVLSTKYPAASTERSVGEVVSALGYKNVEIGWGIDNPQRPVVVDDNGSGGYGYFEESALELVEEKTPNELRAEIVQRAKEFIENTKINQFIVNQEKRTVVSLMRGVETKKVYSKGIAKCNPSDVFNEHIGKAIALGRALGKDVSEFESVEQPTVAVGQIVEVLGRDGKPHDDGHWRRVVVGIKERIYPKFGGGRYATNYKIIDDTNAQYGGVE